MKHTHRIEAIAQAGRAAYDPAFFVTRHHGTSLIVLGLFLVSVLSVRKYDVTAVCAYAAFPVLLIIAARLPAGVLLKRLAFFSPFLAIMAVANPILDQRPFFDAGGMVISAGLVSGTVIFLKSLVTIAAVLAFSLCIPFYRICQALRGFRVPEVFITQLVLLYRYCFLLVEEAIAMQKARAMRSFGKKGKGLFATAKLIGALLLRTTDRADRIFRGMVARGFAGALGKKQSFALTARDWMAIGVAVAIFGAIRIAL
jgi:cobalt/nickel transport system permease protein